MSHSEICSVREVNILQYPPARPSASDLRHCYTALDYELKRKGVNISRSRALAQAYAAARDVATRFFGSIRYANDK